ncbi:type II toxin-antitoxin system HigA family antitoxin [Marinimicrobium sp. ABcell2]|uniref:helix-turn-helix domain-containing protein n=1 Tax=Marinimicrobium sp. ABcell2 TaxID=3069751 RepID=UPI0027AEA596|nr:hypothetical protein [Marinimicrobium sp. ABcell2]MDQ2077491.1 hypothetical protein [Marinimicrobium sp. ABcell2]
MLPEPCLKIRDALSQVPILTNISNQGDYEQALALMDELMEDYDTNKALVDILSLSIERWEERSDEFTGFNAALAELDSGIAVLRTLMSQHNLGVADLPELGSKANVSKLLNQTGGKQLTRKHIASLSQRFGISPALFFKKL